MSIWRASGADKWAAPIFVRVNMYFDFLVITGKFLFIFNFQAFSYCLRMMSSPKKMFPPPLLGSRPLTKGRITSGM